MITESQSTADRLIDVKELADYLGLAVGTIYHLVSEDRLPCVRLSARCLRFRRSDIDAWVAARVNHPDVPNRGGRGRK